MPKRNRKERHKSNAPCGKRGRWNNAPLSTESAGFRRYYQAQSSLFSDEWPQFEKSLQSPLPTVFRLNAALPKATSDAIKQRMRGEFYEMFVREQAKQQTTQQQTKNKKPSDAADAAGVVAVPPPISLPWYPGDGECWQIGAHIKVVRKNASFASFHDFVVQANDNGFISRQEAVSMVPAFLLDVRRHHHVLDMCAAPGSKTLQLAEMLCRANGQPLGAASSPATGSATTSGGGGGSGGGGSNGNGGFLVANDSNLKRTYSLINRVATLQMPAFVVTNHDAQMLPSIKSNEHPTGLKFDRILCDVPCSGDGTLRKAPDLWSRWRVTMAHGLHRIQKRIALRGCDLLSETNESEDNEESSCMVYSTCSFNPIENEAVVAEILRKRPDMELVDASNILPKLIRRPGLSSWKVAVQLNQPSKKKHYKKSTCDDDSIWTGTELGEATEMTKTQQRLEKAESSSSASSSASFSHTTSIQAEVNVTPQVDMSMQFKFTDKCRDGDESLFPPTKEEAAAMHLERCWRLMPQDQNTGGFFVALLRKKKTGLLRKEHQQEHQQEPKNDEQDQARPNKRSKRHSASSLSSSASSASPASPASPAPPACGDGTNTDPTDAACEQQHRRVPLDPYQHGISSRVRDLHQYVSLLAPCHAETWNSLQSFYGLDQNLPLGVTPKFLPSLLFTQSEMAASITWVTEPVAKNVLDFTFPRKLDLVRCGLSLFVKKDRPGVTCKHALIQQTINVVHPQMSKRKITVGRDDMRTLLQAGVEASKVLTSELSKEVGTLVNSLERGSMCFVSSDLSLSAVVAWKGTNDIGIVVSKKDSRYLLNKFQMIEK